MPAIPQAASCNGVAVLELGPEYRLIDEPRIGSLQGGFEQRLRESELRPVVLDLSQVTWACSSFLGLLARWWRQLADRGGAGLAICGLNPALRDRLVVTGLTALWPVYGTRDEAIAAVRARGGMAHGPRSLAAADDRSESVSGVPVLRRSPSGRQ
jgi:anti-anti-sigma factor